MRKFILSYPMLLLVLWTSVLVAGDYIVLDTSARQIRANGFASTTGKVFRSDLGRGALGKRGLDVGYSYTVNGMDYTGHRYRYDDRNGSFDYRVVTNAFPPGSKQTIYYNADSPGESVLAPGLSGCDLLLLLFALPLNIVTFAIWQAAVKFRRASGPGTQAGGVRIVQQEGEKRVRLAAFSPWAAGFFGMAATAFAAAMVVVLVAGFAPSLRLMAVVLILVALGGAAAFLWTAQRSYVGLHDLRLHEASQTLQIPPTRGRKELLLVPKGEIVAVSMHRRVTRNPSGEYFSYVTALERTALGGERQSLPLVNWGWTEGKARAFAGWLSQELGVPFKGTDE